MIDEADLGLFRFAEDAEAVWSELLAGGLVIGGCAERPDVPRQSP